MSLHLLSRTAACLALLGVVACGGGGGETSAVASGELDRTFGTEGRVIFLPSGGMALGAEGSVYVVGAGITKLDARGISVAVYGQGFHRLPLLDESGNLYVVSHSIGGPGISKFGPDGQPVSAFGIQGHAAFGAALDVRALVRDAGGSLYLVGVRQPLSVAIAKFDRDGRLVTSYGSGGMRVVELGGRVGAVWGAAVDAHGNLFVSGWTGWWYASDQALFVAKMDLNGALVGDFGTDGVWMSPTCATGASPTPEVIAMLGMTAITIDAAGDVYLGGRCQPSDGPSRPTVFKLDARGRVVASFRDSGLRPGLFGAEPIEPVSQSNVTRLLVGRDGSVYAAGYLRNIGACGDFAVAKLSANGDPAPAFGNGGFVIVDVGGAWELEIAMDGMGRLYLGGHSLSCPSTGRAQSGAFSVYRLGS